MNIILFDEETCFLSKKDERAKHIMKVLRLREGDKFRAGLINGPALECTLDHITDEGLEFSYEKKEDLSKLHPLTLVLAEVRPICMKRILREVVTLGIGRLILVISDLGEKSYQSSSLYTTSEWRDIMIDGAMQSGFTGLPETIFASSVDDAVKLVSGDECLLLDNVIGAENLSTMELEDKDVAIAIGPERGWSARERDVFLTSGFKPTLMGNRILRTETAAVAATAMTLGRMGLI